MPFLDDDRSELNMEFKGSICCLVISRDPVCQYLLDPVTLSTNRIQFLNFRENIVLLFEKTIFSIILLVPGQRTCFRDLKNMATYKTIRMGRFGSSNVILRISKQLTSNLHSSTCKVFGHLPRPIVASSSSQSLNKHDSGKAMGILRLVYLANSGNFEK